MAQATLLQIPGGPAISMYVNLIIPNTTVPTGLTFYDPGTDGELWFTISNISAYANGDIIRIYNNSGDGEVGGSSKSRYVSRAFGVGNFAGGYGIVPGLTCGTLYTLYAKATSDSATFSAATATAQGTPTLAATDTAYLALEATRNSKTAAATDIATGKSVTIAGSVTNGSALLESHTANQVLKSAGGNYDDDNLSVGNVRPVAFGLSQTGTLANLVATDGAYVTLENTRNNDNGTVAADLATGKSFKTRNTTINGAATLEAHTADQVLHSAGGNFVDENLANNKIIAPTSWGLAQTGTLTKDEPSANHVTENDTTGGVTGLIPLSDVMPASGGTSDKLYSATEEQTRNTPDATKYQDDQHFFKWGVDTTGSLIGGGGVIPLPTAPVLSVPIALSKTAQRVYFSWAADATKIYLEKSLNGSAWDTAVEVIAGVYSRDFTGLTESTLGTLYYYRARSWNSTGYSDYCAIVSGNTKPAIDKLTAIENELDSIIESMTTAAGYYFNWGTSNQPDAAKQTGIMRADKIVPVEETNLDDINGGGSTYYSNQKDYDVYVSATMQTLEANAGNAVNQLLNQANADLKKLINSNQSLGGFCNIVEYKGSRPEYNMNGDAVMPGKMIVRIRVHYTQDRSNPENN